MDEAMVSVEDWLYHLLSAAPYSLHYVTRARTQTENIIIMKVLCIDDTQLANSAVYREEDLYLSRV